jgi:1,4-dihydroxy-2-naphthoate octaprenyltransferase
VTRSPGTPKLRPESRPGQGDEPLKPANDPQTADPSLLPLRLWWPAIRPKTLSLAAVPVFAGAALAWNDGATPRPAVFLLTLVTALLIQAGTNLFNDAEDAASGNDGPDRLGPQRMTGSGLATARQVRRSALLLFALALIGGLALVAEGGLPILLIGLAGLLAGWAYSGGPIPLSHTAAGELFVVAFFGLAAVGGSHYLQSGALSGTALLVGFALGLQAAAVLIMNNLRDIEPDARAGRRTLALRIGRRRAVRVYAVLMLLPFSLLLLAPGAGAVGLAWLALPFAAWLAWRCGHLEPGPAMNRQLALTALAQVLLGGLLGINLMLDAAWAPPAA